MFFGAPLFGQTLGPAGADAPAGDLDLRCEQALILCPFRHEGLPDRKARIEFEREYIHRLWERCGGDEEEMAKRSGLTPERFRPPSPDGTYDTD